VVSSIGGDAALETSDGESQVARRFMVREIS